jgi:hypothetical protein
MSAAAASGAAAAAGAPPPRGDEELDDGPTEWCAMPLGYKRYLLSRGVGTREPRKYSEITHPGSGNLTEKGHAYSVIKFPQADTYYRCARHELPEDLPLSSSDDDDSSSSSSSDSSSSSSDEESDEEEVEVVVVGSSQKRRRLSLQ